MKKVLFLTLGNRDLQLPKKSAIKDISYLDHFSQGTLDSGENLTIKKSNTEFFLNHSKAIWELYDDLNEVVVFPMVQKAIETTGDSISQIVLFPTAQPNLDVNDSYYVGLFLKRWLEKLEYQVTIEIIDFPPINFGALVDFFSTQYMRFGDSKIYFGNSGGTPDMRAATHASAMFTGVEFITIQARTGEVNIQNFRRQEELVLSKIIDKMLNMYDYEGVLNLPVSDAIKEKCRYGLDLYNLKTDIVEIQDSFGEKSKQAIMLLFENLRVSFLQGRYADCLGRIFRVEEGLGQLLVWEIAKERNLINEKDKVRRTNSKQKVEYEHTFKNTISKKQEEFYLQNFLNIFEQNISDHKWYFKNYPSVPLNSGKNFYYYFVKEIGGYDDFLDFIFKLNDSYNHPHIRIVNARNDSYLGHGFKGVSQSDIEDITGPFPQFLEELRFHIENISKIKIKPVFDSLNDEIKKMIEHKV